MYGLSAKKAAAVERFKQESMYGLSAKKVAAVERWPLANHQNIYLLTNKRNPICRQSFN